VRFFGNVAIATAYFAKAVLKTGRLLYDEIASSMLGFTMVIRSSA
jgi:hypothetical protein